MKPLTLLLAVALLAGAGLAAPVAATAQSTRPDGRARLNLVFVLDGLRPDSINAEDTPTLHRLRREGVDYANSHAAVPTVTRVNATIIGSGANPGRNGIVGNSMYVPEVDPQRPFSTGNAANLYRLDEATGGHMVLARTLGERLAAEGLELTAIGSGSSGSTLLLSPRAPRGAGTMINTGGVTATSPFTFPTSVGADILARFGGPPSVAGRPNRNELVDYTEGLLRDYVLPERRPSVVLNWLTEPDASQHAFGAGSPEALATIRNDDRQVGLVLESLRRLGLDDETNVFVVSDHGFSQLDGEIDLAQELVDAGLKESLTSTDVVVANTGASQVHVADRDPARIERIVAYLQRRPWVDVLYTAARAPRDGRYVAAEREDPTPAGWVEGTFSLELIGHGNPQRSGDIMVTYPWTSKRNRFGVRGTSYQGGEGTPGVHGSFSPWDIRNTFIAWGADVKDGIRTDVPAGNIDLTPTIAALVGLGDEEPTDGRVLDEALESGPDEEQLETGARTYRTEARGGRYRAAIRVSEVQDAGRPYVDKSWRLAPRPGG
jgi:predicted AlkP superfamily pyrophosphatase or phosphodiesterase